MQLAQPKKNKFILAGHSKIYSIGPSKTLIYEGGLKNSKFDGYGKLYNTDKTVLYEGEFKDGLF